MISAKANNVKHSFTFLTHHNKIYVRMKALKKRNYNPKKHNAMTVWKN
jgi:hypothetical protein